MNHTYADLSREMPASEMVKRATTLCEARGIALDLGAGSLRDTRYLLEQGFSVTAVDKDPVMMEVARALTNPMLDARHVSFADFEFVPESFDLGIARNALPFESPEAFPELWLSMLGSIKHGGIFCGTLFGTNDTWAATKPHMNFYTKAGVETLLAGLEVLEFNEREEEGIDIMRNEKHWHLFEIIARKA